SPARTSTSCTATASGCSRARPSPGSWPTTRRSRTAPTRCWPPSTSTSRIRSRPLRGSSPVRAGRPGGCSSTSSPRPPSTPATPTSSARPSTARSPWADAAAHRLREGHVAFGDPLLLGSLDEEELHLVAGRRHGDRAPTILGPPARLQAIDGVQGGGEAQHCHRLLGVNG